MNFPFSIVGEIFGEPTVNYQGWKNHVDSFLHLRFVPCHIAPRALEGQKAEFSRGIFLSVEIRVARLLGVASGM